MLDAKHAELSKVQLGEAELAEIRAMVAEKWLNATPSP